MVVRIKSQYEYDVFKRHAKLEEWIPNGQGSKIFPHDIFFNDHKDNPKLSAVVDELRMVWHLTVALDPDTELSSILPKKDNPYCEYENLKNL